MSRLRIAVALVLTVATLAAPLSGAAVAQQEQEARILSEKDLGIALQERVDREVRARESVITVLQRPEIRAVAEALGIDLRDAESAVHTLQGDDLEAAAEHADTLDTALSGGAVIHISLVAALLIVIIIILLAD